MTWFRNSHFLNNINTETRTANCSVCGEDAKISNVGGRKESWRCSEYNRARSLMCRVGIESYPPLLKDVCEICGGDNYTRRESKKLCNDHCDKTKTWRGTLCNECNLGVGKFKDDILLLEKAIEYLKLYSVTEVEI